MIMIDNDSTTTAITTMNATLSPTATATTSIAANVFPQLASASPVVTTIPATQTLSGTKRRASELSSSSPLVERTSRPPRLVKSLSDSSSSSFSNSSSDDDDAERLREKKRVRFSLSHTVGVVPHLTGDEKKDLWWLKEDLVSMKMNAKALSNAIYEQKTLSAHRFGYRNVLQRVYAQCLSHSHSNSSGGVNGANNNNNAKTASTTTSSNAQPSICQDDKRGLFMWISKGHSRRGIERWSIPSVGRHRQTRRDHLIHNLLAAQESCQIVDLEKKANMLREASEQYSQASKLFAAALGEADAYAAHKDED